MSVIEVKFDRVEYSAEESEGEKQIDLIITNPINVDTYFFVLALTYQQYDDQYDNMHAIYPDLHRNTLDNEYDQAECK